MARIFSIVGTRPEAIKMAPVIKKLNEQGRHSIKVISTGQHRELLKQTLAFFGIVPDLELDIMQPNQSLASLSANLLLSLDQIFSREPADLVIAQGDTTSVMVASLLSFYHKIPFAHVEAGLRTGDLYAPFPEELNRMVTGRLASLHFAPTPRAKQNLLKEGINPSTIHVTGNTVIDALLWVAAEVRPPKLKIPKAGKIILVTCHRRENFGAPLENIFSALKKILDLHPDFHIVYPVHPNPNVRQKAFDNLGQHSRAHLIDPLSYQDLVSVMKSSEFVITDSGGIQEEAPSLKKPVLVLRETTERPESIDAGVAELVGTDAEKIFNTADRLIHDPIYFTKMASGANPYGDGYAADRIVNIIDTFLDGGMS